MAKMLVTNEMLVNNVLLAMSVSGHLQCREGGRHHSRDPVGRHSRSAPSSVA
ncbi:hypothetical protein HMPREF1549_01431 [Actinomyces johnsonii F0510]|uniref:Uncharacterized protein n=1 Tax=Actinomyces johnsonii F0510 TaxID=1227262 RepID=U1RM00_9ACTO|nr:hypothetical protein HMPREF1549_01431 [Actinomyces johnsonii F0510]